MSQFVIRVAAIAVVLISAVSCRHDPASPPPPFGLVVDTDKLQYSLAVDRIARVTLTNHSIRPVYLPMDVYVVCERRRDGDWADAFAWFSVDGVAPSFAIAPSEIQTDEFQLWFYVLTPGTYRFRYFVYADGGVTSLLPIEERVSPPFVIVP